MTEADRIFSKFPAFIKDFIYSRGWESLRDIQLAAAKVIFETDNNLLLTSSTASGKTEAAFFPILSELYESMPDSVAVLYIAPLKSLINDQFSRIDELLDMSGVPVFHWHGDVSASHKAKVLREPRGILQITPESLESMLMNRSNDIVRLFGGLRYVIIDEIHTLTGCDRGNQIICQLARISRLIGYSPRRIGLSATIGDVNKAAAWLGGGSGRETDAPLQAEQKIKWRLGLEHFYIQNPEADQSTAIPYSDEKEKDTSGKRESGYAQLDPGYEYLYDCVKDKKSLVFSNSREETEYVTATLRQIAARRSEPDIFLIHHGNLSAAIREEAELKMKDEDTHAVTCATVTMELGIDIGKLERVAQVSSPSTVSSFLQRLGRSGRRGNPPEMMMVFREENPLPNTPLPQMIPWELLRAIAIIQLYIEDRFIEPPAEKKLPFSLAFQQTLSTLASSGEQTPRALAERILALPPFASIPKEDYKELLLSMIKNEFIEMTDERGLIIGMAGERLINSFKFYAVFKDSEDYTVRCESDEIGTITTPPPVGDRFALAGRVWEVTELDIPRRLIYVKSVGGKMEISWPGDFGEIHTRILERMKQVLDEDTVYPYLKPNAAQRLETARRLAKSTGLIEHSLIHLGGYSWCLFPWLGTRSFRTLRRYISQNAKRYGISGIEFEGCCYITFKMEPQRDYYFISDMAQRLERDGIDLNSLVGENECPVFDKYDNSIPPALLRRAYAADRLRSDELIQRVQQIKNEY